MNLWATSHVAKKDTNNMVFYYYYDQLCKAISVSPHVTREVTDTYSRITCFAADRRHIYLQPQEQQGGDIHIGYY